METKNLMDITRVNNDSNGNPRYVVHFLDFLTESESYSDMSVAEKYAMAKIRANSMGASVYRAKWYGGGFVFSTYNLGTYFESMQRFNGGKYDGYEVTTR